MAIQLNLNKALFVPKAYPFIKDYSHRWEIWFGSAGSAKSYSIVQKLIIRCCTETINILVCRRYGTTLRNSCFSLFKEILGKWQLLPYVKIKETDFSIEFPNGSRIIMIGLDDETKLLSLNNISTIWIEEAYEVPEPIVEQLNLRMRGHNRNQQIIMSFNPISKNHWLYKFCANPPENCVIIHSTYKDNPFLSDEYIADLEEMKVRNPARYRVYGEGNWGVDAEGLVITNWEVKEFEPLDLAALGFEHRAGIDLGFIDKTAIIDTLYDKANKTIYVFNEFYKSGC